MKIKGPNFEFKKFLRDNEIYFRTIGTTIVSISAVVIAFFSYMATERQAKLQAEQTKLTQLVAEGQLLPKVRLSYSNVKDDNFTVFRHPVEKERPKLDYEIHVDSGTINDVVEIEVIVFLDFVEEMEGDSTCAYAVPYDNVNPEMYVSGQISHSIGIINIPLNQRNLRIEELKKRVNGHKDGFSGYHLIILRIVVADSSERRRTYYFRHFDSDEQPSIVGVSFWRHAKKYKAEQEKNGFVIYLSQFPKIDMKKFADYWIQAGKNAHESICRTIGYPRSAEYRDDFFISR